MRLALPILLLATTGTVAQPAPDKPYIYDGLAAPLKGFQAPTPVTVLSPDGKTVLHQPAPTSMSTEKPANIELRPVTPDQQQPEPPKPAARSFG